MAENGRANADSDGYVHDPERFRERERERERGQEPSDESESGGSRTTRAYVHDELGEPRTDSFGARGWLLVAALLVAFVVVPATILYIPYSGDLIASLGLTYRDAYLVLPLLPALGLGALSVWVALGSLSR
jgi:hypothetical protein